MPLTGPEPISADRVLAGFDSGRASLDSRLTARALRNEREGGSRTYVICDQGVVVGYYCLATGSAQHRDMPGRIRRNMPDPIPVMLMGRLAVATSHQGMGIARGMVRDAILRTLKAAEIAGIRALLVHALDRDAAGFYRHSGFLESPVDPQVLALPVASARRAIDP